MHDKFEVILSCDDSHISDKQKMLSSQSDMRSYVVDKQTML